MRGGGAEQRVDGGAGPVLTRAAADQQVGAVGGKQQVAVGRGDLDMAAPEVSPLVGRGRGQWPGVGEDFGKPAGALAEATVDGD